MLQREIKRTVGLFYGPKFENSCGGSTGGQHISEDMMKLINRKMDRQDIEEILSQKTNKKAMEQAMMMIDTLHTQLKSLVNTLSHFIKFNFEKETMQNVSNKK